MHFNILSVFIFFMEVTKKEKKYMEGGREEGREEKVERHLEEGMASSDLSSSLETRESNERQVVG